jgi:hypothetical protein
MAMLALMLYLLDNINLELMVLGSQIRLELQT